MEEAFGVSVAWEALGPNILEEGDDNLDDEDNEDDDKDSDKDYLRPAWSALGS